MKCSQQVLKVGLIFTLILFMGGALVFASQKIERRQQGTLAKKSSDGSPEEVRKRIRELEIVGGFDSQRGLFTKPYKSARVTALIEGLNSKHREVRGAALRMLEKLVKQPDVPQATGQVILREVASVERVYKDPTSAEEHSLVQMAQRVSWQIQVRAIGNSERHLEALRDSLEDRTDGFYYPFEAMDLLVEVGTEQARTVLEEKWAESQSRSMSQKFLDRLRISIEKIDLSQRLTPLSPSNQVGELLRSVEQYREDESSLRWEFKVWIIRTIGGIDASESVQVLQRIWKDKSYDIMLRYEAQEALVERGTLEPRERTITFLP